MSSQDDSCILLRTLAKCVIFSDSDNNLQFLQQLVDLLSNRHRAVSTLIPVVLVHGFGHFNDPVNVERNVLAVVSICEYLFAQNLLQSLQFFELLIEYLLQIHVFSNFFARVGILNPTLPIFRIMIIVLEILDNINVFHTHQFDLLVLDLRTFHSIFTVQKFHQVPLSITDRSIITTLHAFHRLDQPPLDVASLRGFARGINHPFASTHRVEEHFSRRQTRKIRIFNKASSFSTEIVLDEMGQRSPHKTIRYPLALNILLTHAGHNLGNVNRAAFRSGSHHSNDTVGLVQRVRPNPSGILTCFVQLLVDLCFKRLQHGLTRLGLKFATLCLHDQLPHLLLGLKNCSADFVYRDFVGNNITNADGETIVQQPEIDQFLQI
mmetsp:Transcript_50100/g.107371  ORF Transcript_50100/g.107371 Transcript_50100/m.107371 type:complete len:379 (+) Transcript_50100:2765-3901(+)